jgi:putative SOS response-associated peptidase YedK
MCGRYALYGPTGRGHRSIKDFEKVEWWRELVKWASDTPRFNIAPTQSAPIIYLELGQEKFAAAQWGLLGDLGAKAANKYSTINARIESAADKPMFKQAWQQRPCIVPASGYFEWKAYGTQRQPYFIDDAENDFLWLAGLWDPATATRPLCFTVLTTAANASLEKIHDRMPVLLTPQQAQLWLHEGPQALPRETSAQIKLRHATVSHRVGNVRQDDAQLIQPMGRGTQEDLFA